VGILIGKLNIDNFGCFKEYIWNQNVDSLFGQLNIIYGRNYSGKTTLSRIFRSLEQKKLHSDFEDGKFTAELIDKGTVSNAQIADSDIKIRVYNSDFKNENLSFLFNKDGKIMPFAILGEKNVETEKKISIETDNLSLNKTKLYGSDGNSGLLKEVATLKKELDNLINGLDQKLRIKARNIKKDSTLFKMGRKTDYNIRDIKSELVYSKEITIDEINKLKSILVEEQKTPLAKIEGISLKFNDFLEKGNELLRKSISPSQSISFLLNNPELQEWVRQGIQHHKDKRERCAFCDSKLTEDIWERLSAHFTKEAEFHKKNINALIEKIEDHTSEIESMDYYNSNNFYYEFQKEYQETADKRKELEEGYLYDLNYILRLLKSRSNNVYNEFSIDKSELNNSAEILNSCLIEMNRIIEDNNAYSNTVSDKKEEAIKKLRLNEIKNFLEEINYDGEKQLIDKQTELWNEKSRELKELEVVISQQQSLIAHLRTLLNDELKAAEKVNEYLSVYLGHPELSLEVQKDKMEKSSFTIKRNGKIAYNLSEGEQTLISFSYFLATLKDIPDTDKSEYMIFIDDPICSLDGGNIFYIFSLIDAEINLANYNQVFISTHNMDFLKYLHRASRKKSYFMIERPISDKFTTNSKLVNMPKYLQKYVTEFIFLFEQIYKVGNETQTDENYHIFYNFPNNARKFLESYLFFKYPNTKLTNDQRIALFFGASSQHIAFLQRINNEFSHGEEQFDRLAKPIDIPEFQKDANLILETIKNSDSNQYEAFFNSLR
jgi:wobble nucleotide-excising tRNase